MAKPLAIELFSGCFGWSAGWLALGGRAVGFDIEHLPHHGPVPDGADLVLQDVLTLHGRQFKEAALILASPPCQEFSYMAMPWKRSKQIANVLRHGGVFPAGYIGSPTIKELTALFDACFRIQREASEAAGRYIPMVVENVKGAQPWVGRARWHHGSYFLWGDVPALMPFVEKSRKSQHAPLCEVPAGTGNTSWFFGNSKHEGRFYGHVKNSGGSWFAIGSPGQTELRRNPVNGIKGEGGAWFNDYKSKKARGGNIERLSYTSSHSSARKAASALIAHIPYALSEHVARCYWPS